MVKTKNKILVVEDNAELQTALHGILGYYNLETVQATTGHDALAAISGTDVDLVVCDISLPDISGHDVLRAVRNDKAHHSLPFIFLTAHTTEKDRIKGMDGGADDYITKPFDSRRLVQTIKSRIDLTNRKKNYDQDRPTGKWPDITAQTLKKEFLDPLESMVNVTYLLEYTRNDPAVHDFKDTLNAMYISNFRLFRNTRNLIALSAIMHGKKLYSNNPFEDNAYVSDILQQILNYYNTGLTHNRAQIRSYVEFVPIKYPDRDALTTIFTELIDNGVKHDSLQQPPAVSLVEKNNGFEFAVVNNTDENCKLELSLVKPFKKFGNSNTPTGPGLGLFVCRSLCERMNLKLEMIREPKKITFTVTYGE